MAGSRTLKLSILADVDNLKKNLDSGSKEVEGFGGKLEKFGKVAAAAFAAAAAAAVAYAGKLAIDGVKAAIEDEAAQARLAKALENVTGATNEQIVSVEKQITKMSLAFGVTDEQLRPAFQRLATATGDLTKANDALSLALDISAATGKSVEAVSNALGKAYEGNTSALARLGIGLSAAEIKALGLDGTMDQLARTFGGAATTQANTLEGQINRLKVLFDETKESVGAGLLPAVKNLLDYFTNNFIPKMIEAKDRALDPIKNAFAENREEMRALWAFTKDFLVPVFEKTLVAAIVNVGKAIGTIINIVSTVIRSIERLVNMAIDGINRFIDGWNAIPDWAKPGGDINRLDKVDWIKETGPVGNYQMSTGTGLSGTTQNPVVAGAGTTTTTGGAPTTGTTGGSGKSTTVPTPTPTLIEQVSQANAEKYFMPSSSIGAGDVRMRENAINITVNGAIDPESVARQIKQIIDGSTGRGGVYAE